MSLQQDYDYLFKLLLIGNSAVALNSNNVETAFITLATEIKSRVQKNTETAPRGANAQTGKTKIKAGDDLSNKKKKDSCC
ncbi:hypothetical protein ABPG72_015754 [Tetrahymena utriculariae]